MLIKVNDNKFFMCLYSGESFMYNREKQRFGA